MIHCGWNQMFGSGTWLTDKSIHEPKVSVYSTIKPQQGKNTFLCHASDIFLDMVRFHWKVLKDDNWVNVEKSDGEVLESSFSDKTRTSMMIIDKQKADANRYACSVEPNREGKESEPLEIKKATEAQTEPGPTTSFLAITCPPANTAISKPLIPDACSGAARSLYLATWMYTLMIFKSMVYFCAISYFLCTKNVGRNPSCDRKAP
ncbi:uncharacterized protein LOC121704690 isoform X1 [Alosa sapidissima]|uniref:uncharacterized protein LOC121704689 isoform X1 n=1 Tax=Alosa sapidissima TaxID=34773 RepID=UPI001C080AE7|nr:uncharacterized protein LOC121704689 isoform X1 [Alosa sapidissima]XP_041941064.1 uncharacterized protein LOC121704689 isoform X1 [Alosa sapidissima]XP_041941068.1 uncharacterized protein LOC121704690 isoform X1 [Alosa sapidissima]